MRPFGWKTFFFVTWWACALGFFAFIAHAENTKPEHSSRYMRPSRTHASEGHVAYYSFMHCEDHDAVTEYCVSRDTYVNAEAGDMYATYRCSKWGGYSDVESWGAVACLVLLAACIVGKEYVRVCGGDRWMAVYGRGGDPVDARRRWAMLPATTQA